jgi:hypothetical protein
MCLQCCRVVGGRKGIAAGCTITARGTVCGAARVGRCSATGPHRPCPLSKVWFVLLHSMGCPDCLSPRSFGAVCLFEPVYSFVAAVFVGAPPMHGLLRMACPGCSWKGSYALLRAGQAQAHHSEVVMHVIVAQNGVRLAAGTAAQRRGR